VNRGNGNPESCFVVQENDILQTNLFKELQIRNESRKQKKQTREEKAANAANAANAAKAAKFAAFAAFDAFAAFAAFAACASPTRDLIKGNRL
jgi:hypothetical protein